MPDAPPHVIGLTNVRFSGTIADQVDTTIERGGHANPGTCDDDDRTAAVFAGGWRVVRGRRGCRSGLRGASGGRLTHLASAEWRCLVVPPHAPRQQHRHPHDQLQSAGRCADGARRCRCAGQVRTHPAGALHAPHA